MKNQTDRQTDRHTDTVLETRQIGNKTFYDVCPIICSEDLDAYPIVELGGLSLSNTKNKVLNSCRSLLANLPCLPTIRNFYFD